LTCKNNIKRPHKHFLSEFDKKKKICHALLNPLDFTSNNICISSLKKIYMHFCKGKKNTHTNKKNLPVFSRHNLNLNPAIIVMLY